MITVVLEPENRTRVFTGVKSVAGLLNRLQLRRTDALFIKQGQLLTPDAMLADGDCVTVRMVTSRG